jgi:hypothetical protein
MKSKKRKLTVKEIVCSAVNEMADEAARILQRHAPPRPAEPTNFVSPPHPLFLNPNEGIWFHYAVGPIDGWFSFGLHGNPPFGVPVQVLMTDEHGARGFVAVGVRTQDIDPRVVKERWEIRGQFQPDGGPRMQMTYWRPLSAPPASLPSPAARP